MATAIEIGNAALAKLGMPASDHLHADREVQRALGVVAQILVAIPRGRVLSSFLTQNAGVAFNTLRATFPEPPAPAEDPKTPSDAEAWLAWLRSLPAVAVAVETDKRARAKARRAAPPLLHFLSLAARAMETNVFAAVPADRALDLATLRAGAPQAPAGATEALIGFALPKYPKGWHVVMTLNAAVVRDPDQSERLAVPTEPRLVLSETELFDETGAPRGDWNAAALRETLEQPWPEAGDWRDFLSELDRRCSAIFGGPLHEVPQCLFGPGAPSLCALVVDAAATSESGWPAVFNAIVEGDSKPLALAHALDAAGSTAVVSLAASDPTPLLGTMDTRAGPGADRDRFALDPAQRLAAVHATALFKQPGVLAVNGPPGTGKTAFLRAVLASGWVQSALDDAPAPPLVYATGATNKAVSNIIEAFGDVAAVTGAGLERRWIDGLPSYGWFFPSRAAAASERYAGLMHLGYDDLTRSPLAFQGAAAAFADMGSDQQEARYLERAQQALRATFTGESAVQDAVQRLRADMQQAVQAMQAERARFTTALQAFAAAYAARSGVRTARAQARSQGASARQLGETARARLAQIEAGQQALLAFQHQQRLAARRWRTWLLAIFRPGQLQQEAAARAAAADQAQAVCDALSLTWQPDNPAAMLHALERMRTRQTQILRDSTAATQRADHDRTTAGAALDRLRTCHDALRQALGSPMAGRAAPERFSRPRGTPRAQGWTDAATALFESRMDHAYRVRLFHLAARYWEGRWLLEQRKLPAARVPWLDERMMLGVVIVATTHRVIALSGLSKRPADLIVLDEAGQADAVVAAGCLALAASALVVGDAQQLQPVTTFTPELVTKLAKVAGVRPSDIPAALNPCTGSGIRLAQHASVLTDGWGAPGITLRYHYRCLPAIIGFCNEAYYHGAMRLVRRGRTGRAGLPPMSWVDVADTTSTRFGTSWENRGELEVIARWTAEHAAALVKAYGKPLDEILAIITPLRAQATLAASELRARLEPVVGDAVARRMMIGTVHSLQGAERPVVAFSLVQSLTRAQSLLADRDAYLLNVAVSRARDAFILFGDRATFSAPRAAGANGIVRRLGTYLARHGQRLFPRHLVIIEAPGKAAAIERTLGLEVAVIPTGGTLRQASLAPAGTLQWTTEPQVQALRQALARHQGLVEDVRIATDDDLAGELIGLHAAELASEVLGDLPVLRMRFSSMEESALRTAYAAAGDRFDADLLAAALTRELVRHLDRERCETATPGAPAFSAGTRDVIAAVAEASASHRCGIRVSATDSAGTCYEGFVADSPTSLSAAAYRAPSDMAARAAKLTGAVLTPAGDYRVTQVPGLYPANTTLRILALAAEELGMLPWITQEHLQALYLEGTR